MPLRCLLALAGGLILAGCATLDEDKCRTANWREMGLADGRQGQPASRLKTYRKDCADYGVQPREQDYLYGRTEGLRDYCRLDNAFQSGLQGHLYQGVCPPAVEPMFRRYHAAAYAVYQTRQEIERVDEALTSRERQLWDSKLTPEERHRLRQEIRDLDRKRHRLRDDLNYQELELDRLMLESRNGKGLWRNP